MRAILEDMPVRRRLWLAGPALAQAAWVTVAVTGLSTFGDALDAHPEVRTAAGVSLAAGWFAGLLALVVPRPVTLVAARTIVPAGLVLSIAAVTERDGLGVVDAVTVTAAAVAAVAVLTPATGEWFVDAVSYGDERRFLLRPPAPVLVFAVVPLWAMTTGGVVVCVLAAASGHRVLAAGSALVAVLGGVIALPAFWRLGRRWIVLVPAGLVVHDAAALTDPVLFPRDRIEVFGPAPADTTALDLTLGALGLALELRLREPVELPVVTGRGRYEERTTRAILVAASRPGDLVREAARRRIPVG